MKEEEEGVTMSEVWRIIKKRIWIILGVSVLIALIAAVLFRFAINPGKTSYSMDFRLTYPTSVTEKYPDGTPFYYGDIITAENLNKAKSSSGEFASVNVNKMLEKDDITIAAETDDSEGVKVYTGRYTITVKGSYFKNREVAENFIRAVTNASVDRIKENAAQINYLIDEDIFNRASFEERMQLLKEQKDTLLAQYADWIELYHATYTVDGKTLENYRAEITVVYGDSAHESLEAAFETNGYNHLDINAHESLEAAIAARIGQLEGEKALNTKIITAIEKVQKGEPYDKEAVASENGVQTVAAASGTEPESPASGTVIYDAQADLSEMLAFYIRRNEQIDHQLTTTLKKENVEAFATTLESKYRALEAVAKTATKVTATIYDRETAARFDMQTSEASGATSMILIAVGGFIVSFIVCAIVVYAVDARKAKKQKNAQESEPPVGQE